MFSPEKLVPFSVTFIFRLYLKLVCYDMRRIKYFFHWRILNKNMDWNMSGLWPSDIYYWYTIPQFNSELISHNKTLSIKSPQWLSQDIGLVQLVMNKCICLDDIFPRCFLWVVFGIVNLSNKTMTMQKYNKYTVYIPIK